MFHRRPDVATTRYWLAGFLGTAAALLAARADAGWTTVDAGRGPVALNVPTGFDPGDPAPLVILLHGFGSSGSAEETYFALASRFDAAGILYATPDGTVDADGNRFWDATPACCDVYDAHPDDVGYLTALIDAIALEYPVDAKRVFFVGHSNGGFMSYRMACDRADRVTAIVSLAGATFFDASACNPSRPVRALEIHGTDDTTIEYEGGVRLDNYPGARATMETWAAYNGCGQDTYGYPDFDFDASIPGVDTAVQVRESECRGGGSELWSILGGQHVPDIAEGARDRLVAWLIAAGDRVMVDGFETGGTGAWIVSTP
jgi:polyhydroxybutyrate depolymerase